MSDPRDVIKQALVGSDLEWTQFSPDIFEVDLPGIRKQKTTCRIEVGKHSLAVHAFVARNVDENHAQVYRWLLERNLRMYGVTFAVDHNGDIYLDGRFPLHAITVDEVDRILGSVLTYADESFNTILELGFRSAIEKEWKWREERGEPTFNLEAFRHLRPENN